MDEHHCELEMDTNEIEYFLNNGDPHADMDKALTFLLEYAKKHGTAICRFVVHKSEEPEDVG